MPDELIRSKNWAELTEAEKALLNGVAASEEEFRLLKLMLSVAGSQANDTPAIGTELPASLRMAFRQAEATPVRKMGWWRYAAAAAVLLGIAGTVWLVRGTNGPEPPVARNTTPAPVSTSENKTVQPANGN